MIVTPVAGKPNLLLGAFEIDELGYAAREFFVSGTATSFGPAGDLGPDGRWSVTAAATADYTTRIVAVTPADPSAFNGTVLVEWLNVSGGIDAPAVWFMAHREIVRAGYAYVAVSAQQVGVQGGASLGFDMSLKTQDPQRYGALSHPGDAFAYDIFSSVGRLIRDRAAEILPDLQPEYLVALGESQSAIYLSTYVNAIDPSAGVYDGFLVHSRFGCTAMLDGNSILEAAAAGPLQPVAFRPDVRVPVLTIITETDLLNGRLPGYYVVRQPDNEQLKVWEIPGTAHADNYTIQVAPIDTGSAALVDIVAAYRPTDMLMGQKLAHCINFAPQHHYVLQAALAALHDWVRKGEAAPSAAPINVTETDPPALALDSNGLASGGVRTPWVDVPIARTSGFGTDESVMSDLFGSGEVFDTETLRRLYPGGASEYLDRFTSALDIAIASGWILSADREEILDLAAAIYPDRG